MKHFKYEFNKSKQQLLPLFLMTSVSQIVFLYFFAVVGHFDHDETNSIMTGYSGVTGLASMVTLCVIAIYGSVLASKLIVRDYIGLNKNKTYLLPVSRKDLFNAKVMAFGLIIIGSEIAGLLAANIVFILSELLFPLVRHGVFNSLISFGVSIIVCVCFTLSIVLIASFVGIHRSSTISVVVSSVILVVIFGNILTRLIIGSSSLSILSSVVIILLTLAIKLLMENSIDHGEAE